jgi:hypothetical protein
VLLASVLCCWRPYCLVGVHNCAVGVHNVLLVSILCCWCPHCAVGVHIVLLASIIVLLVSILCCWRPYCAVGVPAVLVLLLASPYYFWHAVAGGPAFTGFLAVEGVLAVSSVPDDPGVPILTSGFT